MSGLLNFRPNELLMYFVCGSLTRNLLKFLLFFLSECFCRISSFGQAVSGGTIRFVSIWVNLQLIFLAASNLHFC